MAASVKTSILSELRRPRPSAYTHSEIFLMDVVEFAASVNVADASPFAHDLVICPAPPKTQVVAFRTLTVTVIEPPLPGSALGELENETTTGASTVLADACTAIPRVQQTARDSATKYLCMKKNGNPRNRDGICNEIRHYARKATVVI